MRLHTKDFVKQFLQNVHSHHNIFDNNSKGLINTAILMKNDSVYEVRKA